MHLVHETGVDGRALDPLARALDAPTPWTRPGSDSAPPTPRDGYYAEQGQALLRALPDRPVALVAWSSGGMVALHAALIEPARFSALWLYEAPLWASRDFELAPMLQFAGMLAQAALGRERAVRRAFWRMVTRRADGATAFNRDPALQETLLANQGPLLAEVLAGTGDELRDRLGALTVPVHVLVGGASVASSHACAERLASAVSGRLVVVPDADHLTPLTAPERLAAVVGQAG